jgi:hypothetical protein
MITTTRAREHQTTWEIRFQLSRQRDHCAHEYSAAHARDAVCESRLEDGIMGASHGTAVSARVALLIARHHGGDEIAAATSLGIERQSLTDLLSGDWQRFSLDALAALVTTHGVSVRWLLGSSPVRTPHRRPLSTPSGLQALGRRSLAAMPNQEAVMPVTKRLSQDAMEEYFDRFNKRFLNLESTDVADVEVLGKDLGDQIASDGIHLIGITYDPGTHALEVELESGDLRAYRPKEVWAVEEDDGFIRALEIVRDDNTSEIVRVRRLGIQRAD